MLQGWVIYFFPLFTESVFVKFVISYRCLPILVECIYCLIFSITFLSMILILTQFRIILIMGNMECLEMSNMKCHIQIIFRVIFLIIGYWLEGKI